MLLVNEIIRFTRLCGKSLELTFKKQIEGKQPKLYYSGCYAHQTNQVFIKASASNPADDIAEVISSQILNELILSNTSSRFAKCEFIFAPDGKSTRYVLSHGYKGWVSLAEINRGITAGLETVTELSSIISSIRTYLTSTYTKFLEPDTKDTEEQIATKSRLITQISEILVLCYLVGDYDVQPENIGLYRGEDNQIHFAKIDHGWALASLCAISLSLQPTITNPIYLPFGHLGTHRFKSLPKNNFINYQFILESLEFKNVIEKLTCRESLDNIQKAINKHIFSISNKEDLKLLSAHLNIPESDVSMIKDNDLLKQFIYEKVSDVIEARASKIISDYTPDCLAKPVLDPTKFEVISFRQGPLTPRVFVKIKEHEFEVINSPTLC